MRFGDYIKDINKFYIDNGYIIKPEPKLILDDTEVDMFNPFIPTGNYNPQTQTITLYINNRHVKDILRTYCHELIHHFQNISDENFINFDKSGNLNENQKLQEYEAEAYKNGNVMFRKWTEQFKK